MVESTVSAIGMLFHHMYMLNYAYDFDYITPTDRKHCNHLKFEIKSGGHRIALEDIEKKNIQYSRLFRFYAKHCTDVAYIYMTSSTEK